MAKRSSQSFVKRQKEMARKERAQLKNQKRLERKLNKGESTEEELVPLDGPILHESFVDEPEAEREQPLGLRLPRERRAHVLAGARAHAGGVLG